MSTARFDYKVKVIEKLKEKGIKHEFIQLPPNFLLDTASHIAFHGISMKESIPTLIYKTEKGFIIVQKRSDTKIDLKKLKALVGIRRLSFASIDELREIGVKAGIVPLIGLNFPYFVDQKVLEIEKIYGGSGSKGFTLKICPSDLVRVNQATVGDFTDLTGRR